MATHEFVMNYITGKGEENIYHYPSFIANSQLCLFIISIIIRNSIVTTEQSQIMLISL